MGRAFQSLAEAMKKLSLLDFVLQWGMDGECCLEYPMEEVYGVRKSLMFVATSPKCIALNMPKHLFPLLSLRVSHCKSEIRPVVLVLWSVLVRPILYTMRAAFCWTASNWASCVVVREEPHTVEEYSRIGLTSDRYALSLSWFRDGGMVQRMNPTLQAAFPVT